MDQPSVVGIYVTAVAGSSLAPASEVKAVSGRGLEGDRYFAQAGSFSNTPGTGREVTLIESEAIEALRRENGIELPPGASRRNVVTRGVALNHLVEREFRVGQAVLRGVRLCEPCKHLEKLTQPGVMAGLVHRGGLRAEIVSDGLIRVGDSVTVL